MKLQGKRNYKTAIDDRLFASLMSESSFEFIDSSENSFYLRSTET